MLILGEGPTQEIDDTALKAEAKYPINFKVQSKRFWNKKLYTVFS